MDRGRRAYMLNRQIVYHCASSVPSVNLIFHPPSRGPEPPSTIPLAYWSELLRRFFQTHRLADRCIRPNVNALIYLCGPDDVRRVISFRNLVIARWMMAVAIACRPGDDVSSPTCGGLLIARPDSSQFRTSVEETPK